MKKKLLIGFGSLAGLFVLFCIIMWILPFEEPPCELKLMNLTVSPTEVAPNETVTITVEVQSICHVELGWPIQLRINGVVEQSEYVVLDGGETKTVSFSVKKGTEGSYSVRLGRLQGVFKVVGHGLSSETDDGIHLVTPADGAINVPITRIAFAWTSIETADSYNWVLSPNTDLGSPIDSKIGLVQTAYAYAGMLDYDTVYYWQVTALKEGSVIGESPISVFHTTKVCEPGRWYNAHMRW